MDQQKLIDFLETSITFYKARANDYADMRIAYNIDHGSGTAYADSLQTLTTMDNYCAMQFSGLLTKVRNGEFDNNSQQQ